MDACVEINEATSFSVGDEQIKKQKFINVGGEMIYLPEDAISALKGSVSHKRAFGEVIKEARSEWRE